MYGFYTPILILQAFCLYHAYRNNAEQRWYWFILLFPLVGCLIYLFHNFYNRRTIGSLAEGVKELVNSNHKIERLEKALRFSDNVTNRVNLAEAYVNIGRYSEAVDLYKASLTGFMADDPGLRLKLLNAQFLLGDHTSVVELGRALEHEKNFKDSHERVAYAWALHFNGQTESAARTFADMDKSFTNYQQRLELAKFLMKTNKRDEARNKLNELLEEFEHMKGPERKLKRNTIQEIKDLYAGLANA